MAKVNSNETFSANIINAGTVVKGDIECQGDIRFDGVLTGNLITKGKLVIGTNGEIKGDIVCANCDIEGSVEGKMSVLDLLSFRASAKFIGTILTGRLSIEPGAYFSGTCNMHDKGGEPKKA